MTFNDPQSTPCTVAQSLTSLFRFVRCHVCLRERTCHTTLRGLHRMSESGGCRPRVAAVGNEHSPARLAHPGTCCPCSRSDFDRPSQKVGILLLFHFKGRRCGVVGTRFRRPAQFVAGVAGTGLAPRPLGHETLSLAPRWLKGSSSCKTSRLCPAPHANARKSRSRAKPNGQETKPEPP